jgi:hypothetical protein
MSLVPVSVHSLAQVLSKFARSLLKYKKKKQIDIVHTWVAIGHSIRPFTETLSKKTAGCLFPFLPLQGCDRCPPGYGNNDVNLHQGG